MHHIAPIHVAARMTRAIWNADAGMCAPAVRHHAAADAAGDQDRHSGPDHGNGGCDRPRLHFDPPAPADTVRLRRSRHAGFDLAPPDEWPCAADNFRCAQTGAPAHGTTGARLGRPSPRPKKMIRHCSNSNRRPTDPHHALGLLMQLTRAVARAETKLGGEAFAAMPELTGEVEFEPGGGARIADNDGLHLAAAAIAARADRAAHDDPAEQAPGRLEARWREGQSRRQERRKRRDPDCLPTIRRVTLAVVLADSDKDEKQSLDRVTTRAPSEDETDGLRNDDTETEAPFRQLLRIGAKNARRDDALRGDRRHDHARHTD